MDIHASDSAIVEKFLPKGPGSLNWMKIDELRLSIPSLTTARPFILANLLGLVFVFLVNHHASLLKSEIQIEIDLDVESSDIGQVFYSTDAGYTDHL